ncbi:MAG: toxin-activating lysine-acyltransferase [Magnetococcales bacterium]|nr:toxin-activating lysine-acyltransferase [Magnetococcales bacterium]
MEIVKVNEKSSQGDPQAISLHADAASILGKAIWLMSKSPGHRRWEVGVIEDLVMEPIRRRQFKLYVKDNVPVAFVTWAWLSDEAEKGLIHSLMHLRSRDWHCGENLWIVDIVAPFGGEGHVLSDLIGKVFRNEKGKILRPSRSRVGIDVVLWEGGKTNPLELLNAQGDSVHLDSGAMAREN